MCASQRLFRILVNTCFDALCKQPQARCPQNVHVAAAQITRWVCARLPGVCSNRCFIQQVVNKKTRVPLDRVHRCHGYPTTARVSHLCVPKQRRMLHNKRCLGRFQSVCLSNANGVRVTLFTIFHVDTNLAMVPFTKRTDTYRYRHTDILSNSLHVLSCG